MLHEFPQIFHSECHSVVALVRFRDLIPAVTNMRVTVSSKKSERASRSENESSVSFRRTRAFRRKFQKFIELKFTEQHCSHTTLPDVFAQSS